MVNTNAMDKSKRQPATKRDTVQIMRGALPEERVGETLAALEAESHRHAFFQEPYGLRAALADARTKLLLVGADEAALPGLVEAIRAASTQDVHIPVLLYFTQPPAGDVRELLVPEVDDFLLPPLNVKDLLLRVGRLAERMRERVTTSCPTSA
jgi:PleD family two-component response regulator